MANKDVLCVGFAGFLLIATLMGSMGLMYGVYEVILYSRVYFIGAMTVCNVSLSFCICISCMCCLLA